MRSIAFTARATPESSGQRAPAVSRAELRAALALPLPVHRALLDRNQGLILVTGPTGSGKSTTLYAALQELNTGEFHIVTVEDPVEYRLDGVVQIQVQPAIDFTFAKALRHILRHDPDIVLLGEIRDAESAKIAVESALTGHLVLSTLHTNSAAQAVTRLLAKVAVVTPWSTAATASTAAPRKT